MSVGFRVHGIVSNNKAAALEIKTVYNIRTTYSVLPRTRPEWKYFPRILILPRAVCRSR